MLGIGWGLGTCMAQEPQKCTTAFRPKTNETAFAAVGSSLKIADETCLTKYLVIPGKTVLFLRASIGQFLMMTENCALLLAMAAVRKLIPASSVILLTTSL